MRLLDVGRHVAAGEPVTFRPSGHSMEPLIRHRQEVRVVPVGADYRPKRGDVVLAKVNGRWYLHRVGAVQGDRVRIENNKGHVNGWTDRRNVVGIVAEHASDADKPSAL